MSEWTDTIHERAVRVRGTWLRVAAVDAIEPGGRRKVRVHLRSGNVVDIPEPSLLTVDPVESVADLLWGQDDEDGRAEVSR
jgi:hypothetical protein